MKILIIDENAATQAKYAERFSSLPASDVETLDLHIMLVDKDAYQEHLNIIDVVVLGSSLKEGCLLLAKKIKDQFPNITVIIFADTQHYNTNLIKQSQYLGVKRVLPDTSEDLEFLQELYAIDAIYRRDGTLPYGKVTIIASPKGGAGTTTLVAGLGEISSLENKKTLLIDFDFNTQDLTRALTLYGRQNDSFLEWMDNPKKLSLNTFLNTAVNVDENTVLLSPPKEATIGYDLFYHQEGLTIIKKIIELSRYYFENIIIDLGDSNGPAVDLLMTLSDEIVVLTGECALSITACELFLQKIVKIKNHQENIKILATGDRHSVKEIKESINHILNLPESAWINTNVPNDSKVFDWPASGKTIYSLGNLNTRKILKSIASDIGICTQENIEYQPVEKSRIISFPFLTNRKAIGYDKHNSSVIGVKKKEFKI